MKKILSFLALALIVSSCGNKMTLVKRHYTKGYYVHNSKPVNKAEVAAKGESKRVTMSPTVVSLMSEVKPRDLMLTASVKDTKTESRSEARSYVAQLKGHSQTGAAENKILVNQIVKKASFIKAVKQDKRKGDGNIIVMVILACFPVLCLIAVYLHDGGVTTNFWIDLLLHLTVIGEVIYALLVVLDVVDFA